MKEQVIVSWSGGKDSALALYELQDGYEVVALVTTVGFAVILQGFAIIVWGMTPRRVPLRRPRKGARTCAVFLRGRSDHTPRRPPCCSHTPIDAAWCYFEGVTMPPSWPPRQEVA